jgi:glycosyltransferase involved in cell wall biosynthesis
MQTAAANCPIQVFVHLARGFGAAQWQARWDKGEIIGLNDRLPYGYFWAQEDGCTIEYSEDRHEGAFGRVLRLGVRLLLGFDFVHAWRNRRGIRRAEIVWTHTESQYLAVLLLLWGCPRSARPKVIAQSVWLFDRWPRLWSPKRWLYARLIAGAAVLTVLSPENLKVARALFPRQRSEMIPFGVKVDRMIKRGRRPAQRPIRVLSLGFDRHRDWQTLVSAVRDWPDCELRIVAPRLDPSLTRRCANITLVHPKTNAELAALYDWADLVALALRPNLHASGITVIEEATVFGVPVVCTGVGGLGAYFAEGEVRYVPAGDPAALRQAIAALVDDDAERWSMVERAQHRMATAGLTSRRFGQRHAELSRELLRGPAADGRGKTVLRADDGEWPARLKLRAALTLLAIVAAAAAARAASPSLDLCHFHPTFTEDFNTLSVSPHGENGGRWIAHTPWNGDFGDAAFADPRPGFPFRVNDGILEIEARKDAGGKWQSGLLASATPTGAGFAQRYGYFEMRAELPPGPGVWPGFWLNSNQPPDSKAPGVEIDVIEYYGQFPDGYHSAVHIWDKLDPKQNRVQDHVTSVPSGALSSGFHTFGVDVEPDWITFYLDRRETWRVATPSELRDPQMVLVDLALGSGWPIDHTPDPSIMKVDYVHVFAPGAVAEASSGGCDDR